tara:strand:- start:3701 stop:4540 length:840 start_codon:yes stop_codon:yes gene_type:complete
MNKPLISICNPSNRPFLWKRQDDMLKQNANNVDFESIYVGPEEPEEDLPDTIRHIKTGNIKRPQCDEIAIRHAKGEMLLFLGDDHEYIGGGLDQLYAEWQRVCDGKGDNKVAVLPRMRDRRSRDQRLTYAKIPTAPISSLHSALFPKDLIQYAKGAVDIRFVGVYWDCDFAMRLQSAGIKFSRFTGILCLEFSDRPFPNKVYPRLHRTCKVFDKNVLNSFWVRKLEKGEEFDPNTMWVKMPDPTLVVVKNRLKELMPYEDKDILTKSQGPKEVLDRKWD